MLVFVFVVMINTTNEEDRRSFNFRSFISKFNAIQDAKEESYEIGYIQTSVTVILTRIYSIRRFKMLTLTVETKSSWYRCDFHKQVSLFGRHKISETL